MPLNVLTCSLKTQFSEVRALKGENELQRESNLITSHETEQTFEDTEEMQDELVLDLASS